MSREDPSPPDGAEEHRFMPLEDEDAELARALKRRYAERWLVEADLPIERLDDATETVELKVAADDGTGNRRLRLGSFSTGTTYWSADWDGSVEAAFIDEAAELQGGNVKADRRHGPTPWDNPRVS